MKRFFLVIAAAFLGLSAGAQVNLGEKLERDPEVRYGKLPNGLVYYVRHNEKPAQRLARRALTINNKKCFLTNSRAMPGCFYDMIDISMQKHLGEGKYE